jgi:hypothetical protein
MATLAERLTTRFRGVPNVTTSDIADWIAEAEAESGYNADGTDDDDKNNALLYLALSIAYSIIAADAARFFSYRDAEESVDKTMISAQYIKLSANARKQYVRELRGGFASATYANRADASDTSSDA